MSVQLFFLDKMIRYQMKRRFAREPDVMLLRRMMSRMAKRPAPLPAGVHVEPQELGGVPGEVLRGQRCDETRALLYLHGGGMVAGSPRTHRAITGRLAAGLGVPIHAIDYRLAPEHPFPAGIDDSLAAYRALLERGFDGSAIAIAGDSAGGNFTLALALKIKQLGLPMPGALACLSPVTELSDDLPSHQGNAKHDAMFDPRMRAALVTHYCGGQDLSNPLISPLRGNVAGLPPTLIQCSGAEMLRDDGIRMADKMRAAGVEVSLAVWPDVFHVWQLAADVLPEGRTAIADVVAFLRERFVAREAVRARDAS